LILNANLNTFLDGYISRSRSAGMITPLSFEQKLKMISTYTTTSRFYINYQLSPLYDTSLIPILTH